MSTKAVLRSITPPVLWELASRLKTRQKNRISNLVIFDGPYKSWQEAEGVSGGWDASAILEKTLQTSLLLRDGAIEFQQDTIVFSKIVYSPLILATICLSLRTVNDRLVIFDVGGSLGTNFYQNKKIIDAMGSFETAWNVIEVPPTAELGRKHFENDRLRFFDSIEAALSANAEIPQAVIFSGSLQCASDPFALIDQASGTGAPYIAMDRILTSPVTAHTLFVQRPDPSIFYDAAYPVWCFSLSLFLSDMRQRGFQIVEHFTRDVNANFDHGGMLFRRKK
jgi:putative methyltransferase (TIGR04325 family)